MFVVTIETKKLVPAWFKIRLFDSNEKAYEWFKIVVGENMFTMEPSDDTKIITSWSDGETTINMKKVLPDETCPEEYIEMMNSFS